MKVAQIISKSLKQMPFGKVFKYQDLNIASDDFVAATKAVERLIKKGQLSRVAPGIFYKPKQTVFGKIAPSEEELLKPYLFKNNKQTAFITGTLLFNKYKLTTQIPKNIQIASNSSRINTKIGNTNLVTVRNYAQITAENIYLLELLEIIKGVNDIPDGNMLEIIMFLKAKINALSSLEIKKLVTLSLKYPPRVIALLGAILTELNKTELLSTLKKSLNPLTSFKLGISNEILPTSKSWNIR